MAISTTHDIVPDSPTNGSQTDTGVGGEVVGNYATLNPLASNSAGQLSNGNLVFTGNGSTWKYANATLGVKSGKWYWEAVCSDNSQIGLVANLNLSTESKTAGTITFRNTTYWIDGTSTSASVFTVGDTIGFALDLDSATKTLKQYANGVLKNTINIPVNTIWNDAYVFPGTAVYYANSTDTFNFGQRPFAYTAPSGYKALCTANLPDPDIDPNTDDLPEDYMKSVIWEGQTNNNDGVWDSATSTQKVNVGFAADLVWYKGRNAGVSNMLYDSVRGFGVNKELSSNQNVNEGGDATDLYGYLDTINSSNQLELKAGSTSGDYSTTSGRTFVAWCFRAGGSPSGSTSTTGSAKRINTSGTQDDTSCSALASAASATITPTLMSINQKAGFSIVKYVGNGNNNASFPHGLTQTPDIVIIKNLDTTTNWYVSGYPNLSPFTSNNKLLALNSALDIQTASSNASTNGTNVITINLAGGDLNSTATNYIAYCWHSVAGYSAFGSYTGNGDPDGPFVYTGFKPAWLMIKRTDSAPNGHWIIKDSTRNSYNPVDKKLFGNTTPSEDSLAPDDTKLDFLSNGFKLRGVYTGNNATNGTYIYAAFAETPFKYATAR